MDTIEELCSGMAGGASYGLEASLGVLRDAFYAGGTPAWVLPYYKAVASALVTNKRNMYRYEHGGF